jgi:hypothetical protein
MHNRYVSNFDRNLEVIKEMTDPLEKLSEIRQEIIDFVGEISEELDRARGSLEVIGRDLMNQKEETNHGKDTTTDE